MAKKDKQSMLRITLIKSVNRRIKAHQDTVRGLGLRRMHHTVERAATPEIRGMVNKISYLLRVEEIAA